MKAAISLIGLMMAFGVMAGTTYTWTGAAADGQWTTVNNWTPATGYPSEADDVVVFTQAADVVLPSDMTNAALRVSGSGKVTISGGMLAVDLLRVDRSATIQVLPGSTAKSIEYVVSSSGGVADGWTFPKVSQLVLTTDGDMPASVPMTFQNCTVPSDAEWTILADGKLKARYSARFSLSSINFKLGGAVVHLR